MRVFGIDPGSERTGYGCVETDGRRHVLITCGAITAPAGDPLPQRLARIHRDLAGLLASCHPDTVAIENLFHAANARSALRLGHARGVAMLAAVEAGCAIVEYTPAEIKRAVVGYGRAEKHQVQQMIKGGQETIIGAMSDDSFGKLVAFGMGGVLVEVLKDVTFRLAPATQQEAASMLDGI